MSIVAAADDLGAGNGFPAFIRRRVRVVIIGAMIATISGETQNSSPARSTVDMGTAGEARWKTYSNDSYGFQLRYPSQLSVTPSFPSFYHVTNTWRQNALDTSTESAGKAIVRIVVDSKKSAPGTEESYYYDAELRVGAGTGTADIANCLRSPATENTSTIRIHGTDFIVFHEPQAGMSQFADVRSYRTVHKGVCLAIESIITGGGTGPKWRYRELQREDESTINSIISTFEFKAAGPSFERK